MHATGDLDDRHEITGNRHPLPGRRAVEPACVGILPPGIGGLIDASQHRFDLPMHLAPR